MNSYVIVTELLCAPLTAAVVFGAIYASRRRGRILPELWMLIGVLSMSWIEPFFSNAMYTQFHPDFHRLPAWGPFALPQGGLPVLAPPGYAMYYLVPALIAAALSDRLVQRYQLSKVSTLLVVGFVFGVLNDLPVELLQAQRVQLWVFSRALPGLSVGSGPGLVPLSMPLVAGCFVMGATCLLGNRTDDGRSSIDVWAQTHARSSRMRRLRQLTGYVAFCNVLYLLTYIPHGLTKYSGMLTVTGVLEPFPGQVAMQPESGSPQEHGLAGTLIVVSLLAGTAALTVWWSKRAERWLAPELDLPTEAAERLPLAV